MKTVVLQEHSVGSVSKMKAVTSDLRKAFFWFLLVKQHRAVSKASFSAVSTATGWGLTVLN